MAFSGLDNHMSIKFNINEEDRFIRVVSSGTCEDLDQLKEYVIRIHNAVVASKKTRVLVDETQLEYTLSTLDTFYSGRFVSGLTHKPGRIAVVCKSGGWEDTKFWETVAVNRGVMVQVFKEVDSAENWLLL